MTVLEHIESIYSETKFPYLSYLKVLQRFPDKEDARKQMNDLRQQGILIKRANTRGALIEYNGNLRKEFESLNKLK